MVPLELSTMTLLFPVLTLTGMSMDSGHHFLLHVPVLLGLFGPSQLQEPPDWAPREIIA